MVVLPLRMAHQLQLYHVSPVHGWTQLTPLSPQLTRNGSGTSDGPILETSTGQQWRSIFVQLVAVGHMVELQVAGNV